MSRWAIHPPTHDGPYPDRAPDCQSAIEIAHQDVMEGSGTLGEIIDAAQAAGWTRGEVKAALAARDRDYALMLEDNAETERQIALAQISRMTAEEIDGRVMKGRKALAGWVRSGGEDAAAQIVAELGVLKALAWRARELGRPEKALKIVALVEKYR